MAQDPDRTLSLVVRTSADPDGVIGAVRGEIQSLDPHLPAYVGPRGWAGHHWSPAIGAEHAAP